MEQHWKFQINIERLRTGPQWLLKYNNVYLHGRHKFINILNYNISEIVQAIENPKYKDTCKCRLKTSNKKYQSIDWFVNYKW